MPYLILRNCPSGKGRKSLLKSKVAITTSDEEMSAEQSGEEVVPERSHERPRARPVYHTRQDPPAAPMDEPVHESDRQASQDARLSDQIAGVSDQDEVPASKPASQPLSPLSPEPTFSADPIADPDSEDMRDEDAVVTPKISRKRGRLDIDVQEQHLGSAVPETASPPGGPPEASPSEEIRIRRK